MRELKFRIWDRTEGLMVTEENVLSLLNSDRRFDLYGCDEWYPAYGIMVVFNYLRDFVEDKTLEIMQFTGLKDKNGAEIYEGDIVDDSWRSTGGKKINKYLIVKFGEHCGMDYYACSAYGFYLENDKKEDSYFPYHEPIEVIGNIYENPELLEGE